MQFTLSVSALAAFAATVLAQTADFNSVSVPAEVPAGETIEVTWEAPAKYAAGTVSIELIGGETQGTQQPIAVLAGGIPNSAEKFSWAVDATLGDANVYGLVFTYESDTSVTQFSNPFQIVKGEGEGDEAPQTTTISKDYGTKTVTLSSCDCEETTTSIVTPPPAETTPVYTTPAANSTITYVKPTISKTKPAPTTIVTEVETVPEPTTPATVPEEGAAVRFGASSVALVGAFVVAAFAL